jgi:hypothetical protein
VRHQPVTRAAEARARGQRPSTTNHRRAQRRPEARSQEPETSETRRQWRAETGDRREERGERRAGSNAATEQRLQTHGVIGNSI